MTDFKVGDRVRRMNCNHGILKIGDVGVISALYSQSYIRIEGDYENFTHMSKNLVLANDDAMTAPRAPLAFKVGDRVRRTNPNSYMGLSFGDEGIVDKVNDAGNGLTIRGYGYGHSPRSYELVEPAPEPKADTFDKYDERMLPMFTTLAEAADDKGYCSEYDDLAALVGAPSRSEIKALNRPPLPTEPGSIIRDVTLSSIGNKYVRGILGNDGLWYLQRAEGYNHVHPRQIAGFEL